MTCCAGNCEYLFWKLIPVTKGSDWAVPYCTQIWQENGIATPLIPGAGAYNGREDYLEAICNALIQQTIEGVRVVQFGGE